jgi:DNA invertase Pin-like site-specific DNA recombinase
MSISDSIQPSHLTRRAIIYIRQSTPQQVTNHQESLRLQYALTQRALELGWPETSIEIVDADLGRSGATTEGRTGFQNLVADVALGHVGILIAYDATRLARNCSNWYQLLDLCGRTDCLIADRDGVYDPSSVNGRLLLGLKGQISELELHTIRARLTAGIVNKARRGDLAVCLPTGLVRSETGEVVKHPNREVQDRITLVFHLMLEKGAAPRVMRALKQTHLLLPRRDYCGDIKWRQPTTTPIVNILRNPAYAGVFAWGHPPKHKNNVPGKRRRLIAPEDWKAFIKDVYPAYVSWDDFAKIDAMLNDNYSEYQTRQSRGIPRDGKALLQGIVYCGECGHKMNVNYKKYPRYTCNFSSRQAEPVCQQIHADQIDPRMLQRFFEALSAADIDLCARTLAEADRRRDDLCKSQHQQVERLRHEAHLAERQYHHSEPENRLVTAELERRWELALRELKRAEETLAVKERKATCWAIPADLLDALKDIGRRLPDLWDQGLLSWPQKKSLFRALVNKVILRRQGDQVHTRIVWRGGDTTCDTIPVTVGRFRQLTQADQIEAAIQRLAKEGRSDQAIADELTAVGYRSPRKSIFRPSTVADIRRKHGILQHVGFPKIIPGYLRTLQIAKRLKISHHWIYDRIKNGTIQIAKDAKYGAYLFPDKPETLRQFRQLLQGTVTNLRF